MSFSADIAKFIKKTGLKADTVLRKVGVDAYHELLDRSPVLTGRFRGNWRGSIEKVDTTATKDVLPKGTNPEVLATIGRAKFGNTIYLSNNVEYAGVIEHGKPGVKYEDGRKAHSPQAPTGVLYNTHSAMVHNLQRLVAEDLEFE